MPLRDALDRPNRRFGDWLATYETSSDHRRRKRRVSNPLFLYLDLLSHLLADNSSLGLR